MLRKNFRVVFGDAVFLDHPQTPRLGLLGQQFAPLFDLFVGKLHRHQVRFWEIAVVVGVLLRAHGGRLHRVGVPAARLLDDGNGMRHAFALADGFVAERGVNALEGVHVLDLDLGAELFRADRTDGDVDVRAHIPLFEIAVGDACVDEHFLERRQVRDRLVGAGHVRFGDDFHERSSAAVEIDAGRLRVVVDLRGVLFKVDVVDADEFLRSVGKGYLHSAADAQRIAVFGNLVILGHVGIEIVFAVESRVAVDLAAEHHSAHHRKLHGLLVHDRQRPGVSEAYGTDVGVRFAAGFQETAAEHLGVRLELDMSLQPDRIFKFHRAYYTIFSVILRHPSP